MVLVLKDFIRGKKSSFGIVFTQSMLIPAESSEDFHSTPEECVGETSLLRGGKAKAAILRT